MSVIGILKLPVYAVGMASWVCKSVGQKVLKKILKKNEWI